MPRSGSAAGSSLWARVACAPSRVRQSGPGWSFLTGNRYDVDTLRYRFFSHDHIGIDIDEDLHAGSIKIINDNTSRWFHADAFASTRTLLEHIQWSDPPKSLAERLEDNRKLQKQIDRERALFGYRKIA